MEKCKTKCSLSFIILKFLIDWTDWLVGTVSNKTIIVHSSTNSSNPIKHDITLSISQRTAPMHKIVLRHWHSAIKNNLLNLSKFNRIDLSIHLYILHEFGHVKCTIARIHISFHHITHDRELRIERKLRIS